MRPSFRIEPTDLQQAVYAADWMVEDGRSKVAILYESTDYGMGQEEIISQILKESGAEIVCSEAYVLGETKDFTNILTKVKNSGADSIFLAGTYTEGALIVKQQKSLGMTLPCYSSSSMFEVAFLGRISREQGQLRHCLRQGLLQRDARPDVRKADPPCCPGWQVRRC